MVELKIQKLIIRKDANSENHPGSSWCFKQLKVDGSVFQVKEVHNKQFKLDNYKIEFTNGIVISMNEIVMNLS